MCKAAASATVIGIGWVLHDSVLLVPKYPVEDTKTEALKQVEQVGGPVPRALSVISSLGFGTVIAAVVGDDESGLACSKALSGRGILTEELQVVEGARTRRSHVWVSSENASRTIAYSSDTLPHLHNLSSLMDAAEGAEILHLDGRELQAAVPIAASMHDLGKTVVLDAGGWKPDVGYLLKHTDILVISSSTLKRLAGQDPLSEARRLRDEYSLRSVVVTVGSEGTWLVEDVMPRHIPAPVVRAVDTNGAGDAFAGGLIYGLLNAWPVLESVRFGSGVAALACEHFGDFFPSVDDVIDVLKNGVLQ